MDRSLHRSPPETNQAKFETSPIHTSNSRSTLSSSMVAKEDSGFKDPKKIQSLLVAEIDRLNQENDALNRQMNLVKLSGTQGREGDLENKIKILLLEIERLQASSERMRGSQVLSERLSTESESRCRFLSSENEHLNQLLSQAVAENNSLSSKILALERLAATKSEEYSTNILFLKNQLERLSDLNLQKDRDIEFYRTKNSEIESLKAQNKGLQDRFDGQITENAQLRTRLLASMAENEKTKSHEQEIERLNIVINKQKEELSELMTLNNSKSTELEQSRQRFLQLDESYHQVLELDNKLRFVIVENDRLNERLLQKQKEVEELQIKSIENQVIAEERAQDLKNALLKYESNDYEDKIRTLVAQSQKLGDLLSSNNTEINSLRQRIAQLEIENSQVTDLHHRLLSLLEDANSFRSQVKVSEANACRSEGLESKFLIMISENEKLNSTVCDQMEVINRQKKTISDLEKHKNEIAELVEENKRLYQSANHRAREAEDLKTKLTEIKLEAAQLRDFEQQTGLLKEERTRLFDQLSVRNHEVEQLRLKIYQCESFRARIQQLEEQIVRSSGENHRLNSIISENEREIKSLRDLAPLLEIKEREINQMSQKVQVLAVEIQGLQGALSEKTRESDVMRLKAQRVESLDLQVRDLYTKIELLLEENENLNAHLTNKQEEINELSHKMQTFKDLQSRAQLFLEEKEYYLQENSSLKTKLSNHLNQQEKIMIMDQQLRELEMKHSSEYRIHESMVQELKGKTQSLESEKFALLSNNEKLASTNHGQLAEIEGLKLQLKTLERAKLDEIANLKSSYEEKNDLREAEAKIQTLTQELGVLKEGLNRKEDEIEKWALKYMQLEELRVKELQILKGQFESSIKTNIEAQQIKVNFEAERAASEAQILQLQQTNAELELQLQSLRSENKRSHLLSAERMKESDTFRLKYFALEDKYRSEISEFKIQIEYFKSTSYDVKQMMIKYCSDRAADQAQIKQLKQMNQNYQDELEKLYELINQRKTDYDVLAKQNDELKKRYEQLFSDDKENIDSNVNHKESLMFSKEKITGLEKSNLEYKRLAEKNSAELTKRNKDLAEKIQELDALKIKYETALKNYQSLETQLMDKLVNDSSDRIRRD